MTRKGSGTGPVTVIYRGGSGRLRVPRASGDLILRRGGPEATISRRLFNQLTADPTIRLEVVTISPSGDDKPAIAGKEERADG